MLPSGISLHFRPYHSQFHTPGFLALLLHIRTILLCSTQNDILRGAIMHLARVKDYNLPPPPGHYRFLSVVLHSRLLMLLPSLDEH